jgi:uncharacterized protein YutE (UPF0331/DUF86 family)
MDRQLIEEKLEALRRCVVRIEDKCPDHNYEAINWKIVHAICTQHLSDFRDFAASIAARL